MSWHGCACAHVNVPPAANDQRAMSPLACFSHTSVHHSHTPGHHGNSFGRGLLHSPSLSCLAASPKPLQTLQQTVGTEPTPITLLHTACTLADGPGCHSACLRALLSGKDLSWWATRGRVGRQSNMVSASPTCRGRCQQGMISIRYRLLGETLVHCVMNLDYCLRKSRRIWQHRKELPSTRSEHCWVPHMHRARNCLQSPRTRHGCLNRGMGPTRNALSNP